MSEFVLSVSVEAPPVVKISDLLEEVGLGGIEPTNGV